MISSTNGVPVELARRLRRARLLPTCTSPTAASTCTRRRGRSTSQGRANVSHGCINLSPADAQAFFEFSRVGDVVHRRPAAPARPALGDHGVMDWDTAWSDFTPANALLRVPARARIAGGSRRNRPQAVTQIRTSAPSAAGGERRRARVGEAGRVTFATAPAPSSSTAPTATKTCTWRPVGHHDLSRRRRAGRPRGRRHVGGSRIAPSWPCPDAIARRPPLSSSALMSRCS